MPSKESIIDVIANSFYANLFLNVFGPNALSDDDIAYDYFAQAIAAYERSPEITSFSSKFDVDQVRFTVAERNGRILFETNCASCHSTVADFDSPSPLFTNYQYANIGTPTNPLVPLLSADLGLGATVADTNQDGKFKVPTLRNIAASPPYTHNGYFSSLKEMVAFINDNSAYTPELDRNIDTQVGTLGLTDEEVDDLVSFLLTLTDN